MTDKAKARSAAEEKTVVMQVTVTVTPPDGHELTDEKAIQLAMSAVTQSH